MYSNITVKVESIPSTTDKLAYISVKVFDYENVAIAFFTAYTVAFAMTLLTQFLQHRYMENV